MNQSRACASGWDLVNLGAILGVINLHKNSLCNRCAMSSANIVGYFNCARISAGQTSVSCLENVMIDVLFFWKNLKELDDLSYETSGQK